MSLKRKRQDDLQSALRSLDATDTHALTAHLKTLSAALDESPLELETLLLSTATATSTLSNALHICINASIEPLTISLLNFISRLIKIRSIDFLNFQLALSREILTKNTLDLHKALGPGNNARSSCAVKLLICMIRDVEEAGWTIRVNKVWNIINMDIKNLNRLLGVRHKKAERTSTKADTRTLVINLLLILLKSASSSIKTNILSAKGLTNAIVANLKEDTFPVIADLLTIFALHILPEQKIKLSARLHVLESLWPTIIEFLPRDSSDHFLYSRFITYCVDYLATIKASDPSISKCLHALLSNLKALDNGEHLVFIKKLLSKHPDLSHSYWNRVFPGLEPKASSKWIIHIAQAIDILKVLPDVERISGMKSLTLVEICFPSLFSKVWLSKGLQHDNAIVVHMLLLLLLTCLQKAHGLLSSLPSNKAAKLRGDLMGRLPDPQLILALVQKHQNSSFRIQFALRALELYYQVAPSLMLQTKFDLVKLAGNLCCDKSTNTDHQSAQATLLRLIPYTLSSSNWLKGDTESCGLAHLVNVAFTAESIALKLQARAAIKVVLQGTQIFDHDADLEIDVWLHLIDGRSDKIRSLWIQCVLKANSLPFRYMEQIDSILNAEELLTVVPNALIGVWLEQCKYRTTLPDKGLIDDLKETNKRLIVSLTAIYDMVEPGLRLCDEMASFSDDKGTFTTIKQSLKNIDHPKKHIKAVQTLLHMLQSKSRDEISSQLSAFLSLLSLRLCPTTESLEYWIHTVKVLKHDKLGNLLSSESFTSLWHQCCSSFDPQLSCELSKFIVSYTQQSEYRDNMISIAFDYHQKGLENAGLVLDILIPCMTDAQLFQCASITLDQCSKASLSPPSRHLCTSVLENIIDWPATAVKPLVYHLMKAYLTQDIQIAADLAERIALPQSVKIVSEQDVLSWMRRRLSGYKQMTHCQLTSCLLRNSPRALSIFQDWLRDQKKFPLSLAGAFETSLLLSRFNRGAPHVLQPDLVADVTVLALEGNEPAQRVLKHLPADLSSQILKHMDDYLSRTEPTMITSSMVITFDLFPITLTLALTISEKVLLHLVRRFAEDDVHSAETSQIVKAFSNLLFQHVPQNASVAPLKSHLVEPVIEAAIAKRMDAVDVLYMISSLLSRITANSSTLRYCAAFLASPMLNSNTKSPILRPNTILVMQTFCNVLPENTVILQALLDCYEGTLSTEDRLISSCLRCAEMRGTFSVSAAFTTFCPPSLLHTGAKGSAVLEHMDQIAVHQSCLAVMRANGFVSNPGAEAYDPEFMLGLLNLYLNQESLHVVQFMELVNRNVIGIAICGLSAPRMHLRRTADRLLSRLRIRLQAATFIEQEEIMLVLDHVANLAAEPNPVSLLFLAQAFQAIGYPSHSHYPLLFKHMLQRSSLEADEVPLLYQMLYPIDEELAESNLAFFLSYLQDCMCQPQSWLTLRRRQVIELLLGYFLSGLLSQKVIRLILELLINVTQFDLAATELVRQSAIFSFVCGSSKAEEHESLWLKIVHNLVKHVTEDSLSSKMQIGWLIDSLTVVASFTFCEESLVVLRAIILRLNLHTGFTSYEQEYIRHSLGKMLQSIPRDSVIGQDVIIRVNILIERFEV